jgi:hypothetical protein
MLHPTPTCTRFQITIEMPCLKCGNDMRLSLIEPCSGQNLERLTYRCTECNCDERFLMAKSEAKPTLGKS